MVFRAVASVKGKQTRPRAEVKREKKATERKAKKEQFDVVTAVERERMREEQDAQLKKPLVRLGRPSLYTEELALRICALISTTSASMAKICDQEGMPDPITIIRWRHTNDAFRRMYTQAKEDQADLMADEIVEISDNTETGEKIKYTPMGVEVTRSDMIEHRRLRVEARKWAAAKLNRKYGNQLALTGAGGGLVAPNGTDEMSDEQLAAIAATEDPGEPQEPE